MDPAEDDNLNIEKQSQIIKKMFLGGFFFLPWLWLINALYYREYIAKPGREIPSNVKNCESISSKLLNFTHKRNKNNSHGMERQMLTIHFYFKTIDVRWSLVGFCVWSVAFLSWITIFVMNRNQWGAKGDSLSMIVPNGI
eukprot:TRINITY_DN3268_c0_g1_i1.p1 TRINITY_DN3268_c0_g1~~TRINITY_DN3268_c0_g1_i1.p1  ORF type:complete len:140 (+),score=28.65 TRINITY_DN3268_c0_g1_i1:154-573(+)